METQIYQLLLRSSSISHQEQIYNEVQLLIQDQNSIFELINIAGKQDLDIQIIFQSLVLLRLTISNITTEASQSNYFYLLKISDEIQQRLSYIFYSPPEASVLVSQFAALCCHLKYRLDSLYYILTETLQVENLQFPIFFTNIQSILVEIIQNEEIYQNSFIIALEILLNSNDNQIKNLLNKDFCQHIYPFIFHSKSSSEAIQILNLMHDFSIIPFLIENISKLNQRESIIQFIKFVDSFYSSTFLDENLFLNALQTFNFVFGFLLKIINENEDEMIVFESILFFLNLFNNILSNMNSFALSLNQLIFEQLNALFFSLFEKVGIDKNIDFFGISSITIKTIQLITFLFPSESFQIIFSKFESTLSNSKNSDSFHILCLLRIFSKILSRKNKFLMNSSSLFDILKLGLNSSMNYIQYPEFVVESSILFTKSFKMIVLIQTIQKVQIFDSNMIGNNGFDQILQAYSIYNIDIKQKLSKVILSLLHFTPISFHIFFKRIMETFINSKSIHEYLINSYVLGTFIERSILFNNEKENDLKPDILNLIQFTVSPMMNDNFFFVCAIHILDSLIVKFPEVTFSVISSIWPKIIEYLTVFISDECNSFYQFDRKLNYENVSSFSWIMHFLINMNKLIFALKFDNSEFTEPIINIIPAFLNPELPKTVIKSAWMYLNNLVDVTIQYIKNDEDNSTQQLKFLNELSIIVKNSIFLNFSDFFKYNCDEENEPGSITSIIGVIAATIFNILRNSNFLNADNQFFVNFNEIQIIFSIFLHVFDENNRNSFLAIELVTCCLCMILINFPDAADQVNDMIDADTMAKMIHSFSEIKDETLKILIAPGIRYLFASNSISNE